MDSVVPIEMAGWAMRLEQSRAEAASFNIATANVAGSRPVYVDFASQLEALRSLVASGEAEAANDIALIVGQSPTLTPLPASQEAAALDEEVASLAAAELRFKTLAETISREFALLTLAASGRQ